LLAKGSTLEGGKNDIPHDDHLPFENIGLIYKSYKTAIHRQRRCSHPMPHR
jgi:hypothetical protein